MISRVVIRSSHSGWVVEENNRIDNLIVFRSDEPERFVRYLAEKVAGIKIDRIVESRSAEIAAEAKRLREMVSE